MTLYEKAASKHISISENDESLSLMLAGTRYLPCSYQVQRQINCLPVCNLPVQRIS